MFIKILIYSIKSNQIIVKLQLLCNILSFTLVTWGYSDLFEYSSSCNNGIISSILLSLFKNYVNITIVLVGIWALAIKGYLQFINNRKQLWKALYICGMTRYKISMYILFESILMITISLFISNLLYWILCGFINKNLNLFMIIIEIVILIGNEILLYIIFICTHFYRHISEGI